MITYINEVTDQRPGRIATGEGSQEYTGSGADTPLSRGLQIVKHRRVSKLGQVNLEEFEDVHRGGWVPS